jgi:hypothetical protein
MADLFIVGAESEAWRDSDASLMQLLESQHLYKSLSLLLAQQAGVKAPASLLLFALRRDLIAHFANRWGLPLMMRVDYRSRPKSKPVGGIPLYKFDTIYRVSEDLLERRCLPLFHPHFDRFKDVYSLGAILSNESSSADVEVVGKGFDAGDLRLGQAIPHETFQLNLATGKRERHNAISDDSYRRERINRGRRIVKLKGYADLVNKTGSLIDADTLGPNLQESSETAEIPQRYQEMPSPLIDDLLGVLRAVKTGILPGIPRSKIYVASLSYLEKEGWMLWDVYGDWYHR